MIRSLPLLMLLAACSARPPPPTRLAPVVVPDQHIPDYAKRPYEPFGRGNAVAIARREWRAFGSVVNDDPPSAPFARSTRPDLQPGLWQRVGDYWWFGMDAAAKESGWTSRYNEYGTPFSQDAPAWSAAFISYVMRAAGAGTGFPYSPLHADYINAAARNEGALRAERTTGYAAREGDLICVGRAGAQGLTFDDLPANRFFGHCDIVVSATPGRLQVIGGNVVGGVTLKNVPTTADGLLAGPDGRSVDGRFPWFVVLRVDYAQ